MKFELRKVRINKSGYDSTGRYWGIGAPLYRYQSVETHDNGHCWKEGYIRAKDRDEAKATIRSNGNLKDATFLR